MDMTEKANSRQIGGDHYQSKNPDALQHWDIVARYSVGYLEGCATKYIARWRKKNGIEDLEKAGHYVSKIIELYIDQRILPPGLSCGLVPDHVCIEYVKTHQIPEDEAVLIFLLFNWRDLDDLCSALHGINKLIESHQT